MGHTRTFGSVTLDEDAGTLYQVPHIGEPVGGSIEGASARVDAGVVDSHVSAGRVVAFGVFALAAKKKTGQVFLTVEHPEYAFTYAADFRQEAEMRAFAAEINNAARRQYDPGRPLNRPTTRTTRALAPIEATDVTITLDETILHLEARGWVARGALGAAKLDIPRELIASVAVKLEEYGPGRVRFTTRSGIFRNVTFTKASFQDRIRALANELNSTA